jgi:CRP-like cAMP-binding protein
MISRSVGAFGAAGSSVHQPLDLGRCALFRDLSPSRIADLDRQCRCIHFAAGDVILSAEENNPHDVFVVLEGTGEVLRKGPFGDSIVLATLHPGMCFGEFSAIDGRSGSATVKASSDALLAEIPREVFRLLLRDEPSVAWLLMERMVHLIRTLDARIAGLQGCQEEFDRLHRELLLVNL